MNSKQIRDIPAVLALTLLGVITFVSYGTVAPDPNRPLPVYAAVKKNEKLRLPNHCERVPAPCPQRGLVVAISSFLSSEAYWTIVDFDSRTATRIVTSTTLQLDGTRKTELIDTQKHTLANGEIREILTKANEVWNPTPPPKGYKYITMPADSFCDVTLFDDNMSKTAVCYSYPIDELLHAIRKVPFKIPKRSLLPPPQ